MLSVAYIFFFLIPQWPQVSQSLECGGSEQIHGIDVQRSRKYHTTNKVRIISVFYIYRLLSHRCSYLNLSKMVSWMRQGILLNAEGEAHGSK